MERQKEIVPALGEYVVITGTQMSIKKKSDKCYNTGTFWQID